MNKLLDAKSELKNNNLQTCSGGNFFYGQMSHYAFKNPKWGMGCNVVYIKPDNERGRFLLLSEFTEKFNDNKWSLSDAELLLDDKETYIMTNLSNIEIAFIKKQMFNHHFKKKDW